MPKRRDRVGVVPAADRAASVGGEQRELEPEHRQALDLLFTATYQELCRIAASIRRSDAGGAISTTTLVHETWMKLAQSGSLTPESQLHLKHMIAKAMRQFVIEAARRRRSVKRGAAAVITLDESIDLPISCDRELLALHAALEELERVNPRHASLVELRFFGGFEVVETARLLGIAESTALRDWRSAKAWLATQIRRER